MNIVYLASSFFITGISLLALRPIAIKVGLVDLPGGRKTHINATPLVGGLGIFLGIFCISVFTPGLVSEFGSLLSLSALVLFMGTVDDAKELTPNVRMTGHGLVALAMAVVAEIQLNSLGDLFYLGGIKLGVFAIPFTIFATVGVINAINMADGIDGLSGGLVIVALGFIALLSFENGEFATSSFIVVVVCSIMAFLSMNFRRPWHKKALVYLGDAGSTMLGFMLAWLLIDNSQGDTASFKPVYALWFLAVPLFDTVNLLIKRPLRGISSFTPGTDHLHHNLLSRGYSVEQVVAILIGTSVLFGAIGLTGFYLGANEAFMFQLFVALFALYFIFSERIKAS
jgi:UDP-GlcNAc:undecaprenyl-phosphate GlcNAc-1-phosphate transferase